MKLSKNIEGVQKRCRKVLYPSFSYTEAMSKCDMDRLDYHRDMITQNVLRQIKDLKHALHYFITYNLLLKYPKVRRFCGRHIHINFHLVKLLVMDEILCHIAFPRRFSVLNA